MWLVAFRLLCLLADLYHIDFVIFKVKDVPPLLGCAGAALQRSIVLVASKQTESGFGLGRGSRVG